MKIRNFPWMIVLSILAGSAHAADTPPKNWIGGLRSKLPEQATWIEGNMLGNGRMWERRKYGNQDILILFKNEDPAKGGASDRWTVTDTLEYPVSPTDQNRRLAISTCGIAPKPLDGDLIAVVDSTNEIDGKRRKALKAWRMNGQSGKFQPLPPQGITCANQMIDDHPLSGEDSD